MMAKSPMTSEYDLSSLKYVASGAAPLKADTEAIFKARTGVSDITDGWQLIIIISIHDRDC